MKNLQSQFVILLTCLVAYHIRFDTLQLPTTYIIVLLIGMLIAGVILPATGAFRQEFRWAFLRKTRRLIAGWAIVVTSLVTMAAMLKVSSDYSRVGFGYWVVLGGLGLIASQLIEHGWQIHRRKHNRSIRRLVLAGGGNNGKRVERRIVNVPDGGL